MKRPAVISFSGLISVVLLYLVLVGTTLFFSDEVLASAGSGAPLSSFFTFILGGILPLALAIGLITQLLRLVIQLRRGQAGMRFKLRIMLFLNVMILLATIPQAILFTRFVNGLLKTELANKTMQALDTAVSLSLESYENNIRLLENTARKPLRELWWDNSKSPDEAWTKLQSLPSAPEAMQIFNLGLEDNYGNSDLWISASELKEHSQGFATRRNTAFGTQLRISFEGPGKSTIVLANSIPSSLEKQSELLSKARDSFASFLDVQQSINPTVSLLFISFMLPLVLLAMATAFVLSDEIIRPLVNLEATMMRIARGDFNVRLTIRKGDEMGFLVKSFNMMMHELAKNRESLKQNERLQTWQDIAQRMAHEIKNPLTPIKLSAQRALHRYQGEDPEFRRILETSVSTIVNEVDNLAAMLTEFRNFARLPQPIKVEIFLGDLLHDVIEAYKSQSSVTFDLALRPDQIKVSLDPVQIRQVLHNLVQNSIDAMNGVGVIHILANVLDKGGKRVVRIQCTDTGPGIAKSELAKVFTPYYTTKTQGNGLGLSIVEKIVLDHGGEIWCEDTDRQGACFVLELPYDEN